ncbi:MAG TPA: DUF177 domain-containing protein [Clostridia bacterium]|nr:DUF177 domain-containing protein [Clostridia bacterium]
MVIDISDILMEVGSSKDFDGEISIEDIVYQGENIRFDKPLRIEGTVVNADEFIMLSGHLYGYATLQCGVCTEPYDCIADYDLQVNLKPLPDEEDPDIYVYVNDLIHLDDIIIREFILRLPTQRRCSEECRGLCPFCGVNLNREECHCTDEDHQIIDSRLEKLKDFYVNRDREV